MCKRILNAKRKKLRKRGKNNEQGKNNMLQKRKKVENSNNNNKYKQRCRLNLKSHTSDSKMKYCLQNSKKLQIYYRMRKNKIHTHTKRNTICMCVYGIHSPYAVPSLNLVTYALQWVIDGFHCIAENKHKQSR